MNSSAPSSLSPFDGPEAGKSRHDAPANTDEHTVVYHPCQRPALAWLGILDDASEAGEWLRLRTNRLTIGRVNADVVIPFDNLISAQHAELYRSTHEGENFWTLRDLNSTNGTYVRVLDAALMPGQHLLLGGGHFRFEDPLADYQTSEVDTYPEQDERVPTQCIDEGDQAALLARLVELTEKGVGRRLRLDRSDNWLGRDPTRCNLVVGDDRMLSPVHARLYRGEKGTWRIADLNSLNGVWLRVKKVKFRRTGYFQLGEQRFILRLPG